jgi:hypothetical protein
MIICSINPIQVVDPFTFGWYVVKEKPRIPSEKLKAPIMINASPSRIF